MPDRRVRSLRATLALWMIPASLCVFGSSIWLTQNAIARLADSAYDRSLSGALRAIEADLSVQSGGLGIELPYALFANLQAAATGTVYFRVSTDDGLVQIGDTRLPDPPSPTRKAQFFDATFLGQSLRVGAVRKQLAVPLYGAATPQTVLIEVAETTASREAFLGRIARLAFWRDATALLAALAVLVVGVGMALRPLLRLRDRFDRRAPGDLSPLDGSALPAEVRPLIDSFNALMARHADQAAGQKRFFDDASHQLRTPLSVLRMQLDYALTTPDPAERHATLEAMRAVVDRTARTTGQLLALARVDSGAVPLTDVDLSAVLREVAFLHLPAARRKRIALDLDLPDTPVILPAAETLLYEAVSNLLDNAVRLSPAGGEVTLRLDRRARHAAMTVSDRGPGMTADRLARVGERFLSDGEGGAGIGLSLAVAVARMHGGTFTAANRAGGGLEVALVLPLTSTLSKNRLVGGNESQL
ncbi:sensor histidine kinase [Falsirhodobacter sp. 1013]|uniref:sensor histidine kinase n=1 Tax=Falsirhodobacter sp. 1013 TaxID=3417566 RepID=UPI003EB69DD0